MQVTIQKWGDSQGIRIPNDYLDSLGVYVNDEVEIEKMDECIIIKKPTQRIKMRLEEQYKA